MSILFWITTGSLWALFVLPFIAYGITIGVGVGLKRLYLIHEENQNARS